MMKIIVKEHKKLSPFMSLFCTCNQVGKKVLKIMEKKHFDTTDLYALRKIGFQIIFKKDNTQIGKYHDNTNNNKK